MPLPQEDGKADNAGAIIRPYIRRSLPSMAPQHTVHPVHGSTTIPGSLLHTTAMDGGSADNAGAIIR